MTCIDLLYMSKQLNKRSVTNKLTKVNSITIIFHETQKRTITQLSKTYTLKKNKKIMLVIPSINNKRVLLSHESHQTVPQFFVFKNLVRKSNVKPSLKEKLTVETHFDIFKLFFL